MVDDNVDDDAGLGDDCFGSDVVEEEAVARGLCDDDCGVQRTLRVRWEVVVAVAEVVPLVRLVF